MQGMSIRASKSLFKKLVLKDWDRKIFTVATTIGSKLLKLAVVFQLKFFNKNKRKTTEQLIPVHARTCLAGSTSGLYQNVLYDCQYCI